MILTLAASVVFTVSSFGQSTSDKKAHTFHGKVEAVNKDGKSLTVNGEKVEGWMDAMTMNYKVDDRSVLDKLKPGDQITATVYDGDYSLQKVQVTGTTATDSKSKK
jgi:protein SCO1/2